MAKKMTDELINKIGSGWRFQTIILLFCGFHQLLLCFSNVVMALFHMTPEHHCQVPDEHLLNISLPLTPTQEPGKHPYESCSAYVNPFNHSAGVQPCENYTYYTVKSEHTIVKEWNLVCDLKYLPSLSSTVYFIGMTLGSLFFGHLADTFGRKPVVLACVYLQTILGISVYFVQDVLWFIILRALLGAVIQGNTQSSLTLLIELSPTANRGYVAVCWAFIWSAGVMIFGTLAYYIRQWRTIQLIITTPAILSCIYSWFIPESLRWLLSKGKIEKAKHSVEHIASWNGIPVCENIEQMLETYKKEIKKEEKELRKYNYFHLFKTSEIRKRTLIIGYAFCSVALFYYGILLNITDLSGDRYLNFVIGSALELIVKIGAFLIINRCKRTNLLSFTAVISAALCIIGVFIKRFIIEGAAGIISTMLILASKAVLGATFAVCVLLTNELIPTVVRNMGNGVSTFTMRVGGILAPQFITIGRYTDTSIPFIIYGIAVLISAGLAQLLPETKNARLPDTIAEIEENTVEVQEEMKEVSKT